MTDRTPARDPRVDRLVSWGLSTVSAVALSIGAWFFSNLDDSLRALRAEIGELRERIAVLQVAQEQVSKLELELREVRGRVRALERAKGGPR